MTLFRTDRQLALNDLLVATSELANHYQDAANFLDDGDVCAKLEEFSKRHLMLTPRLEQAIRAEDDLPTAPDPDREAGASVLEHIGANLSADEAVKVIEHRVANEETLSQLIKQARDAGLGDSYAELLKDLDDNNQAILQSLRELLAHRSSP